MTKQEKTWKEIAPAGVCSKSSTEFLTGVLFCPDGAIHWYPEKGDISFDYRFCKGCGICANQCPTNAITMKLAKE